MPRIKNSLRRMSLIYNLIKNNGPISKKDLTRKINLALDEPVCNSTIEKDLFNLKMDFDIEYKHINRKGYVLEKEVNFDERVLNYVNFYV